MKLRISTFLRPRKHQNHRFHSDLIAFFEIRNLHEIEFRSPAANSLTFSTKNANSAPYTCSAHNPAVTARILRRPGHAHPHTRAPSVRQAFAANHRRHVRTTALRPSLQSFCFRSTQRTTCLRLFQAAAAEWAKPNEIRRGTRRSAAFEEPYGRVGYPSVTPFLSSVH